MKLPNTKNQTGFTIIEVLIVLAIAALILVVVLIAVPQLQQNQRNNARQAVANRIVAEVNNYAGNNNGRIPEALPLADRNNFADPEQDPSFFARYFDCDGVAAPATSCGINIEDPQTGLPVGVDPGTGNVNPDTTHEQGVPQSTFNSDVETIGTNAPDDDAGSIHYATGAVCDGELMTTDGAVARNFAFSMRLEGGAIYCLDNS